MGVITRGVRIPIVLALSALVLYLPGFWWGAPHASAPDRTHSWAVDAHVPLGPLAQINNIFQKRPDRTLHYPLMHSFVITAAYAPYLGYLWLTGELQGFSRVYPFGLVDPAAVLKRLTWIAHFVAVLMAVCVVVVAHDAGKALWDARTGVLAALFVLLSFPMFFYSRTGNVDMPMLCFVALAAATFARCWSGGFTMSRAIWLGVWAGLALATKEPAAGLLIPMALWILLLHRRENAPGAGLLTWAFWKKPAAALAVAFLVFGTGSGLFVDPERYFAHIAFQGQMAQDLARGEFELLETFPFTWDGNLQLAGLIVYYLIQSMTLPGLLLACLGVIWTLVREPLKATFAASVLMYTVLFIFMVARSGEFRYVMPIAFLLAFFAARAVSVAWESRWSLLRTGGMALTAGIFTVGLMRGMDLTYLMIHDSRYAAQSWLRSRAEANDRIGIFGPTPLQPPLDYGVVTLQAVEFKGLEKGFLARQQDPQKLAVDARNIIQAWTEHPPRFIIVMPDFTSLPGMPHSGTCPPQVYRDLLNGSLGYRLAAFFKTPPLLTHGWLRRPEPDFRRRDPTVLVNPPIRIFVREKSAAVGTAKL